MASWEVQAASDYPVFEELLPEGDTGLGRYQLRFARTREQIDAIQRLRYDVFNVELGEGLEESHLTERDRDRFDPVCHHLMVLERDEGTVVGTYRMQTSEMASRYSGFYSADEFTIESLPRAVIQNSVEVGRACVSRPHRNRQVLFLLWRGLAQYMQRNRKRYLFGCCSLTSQDPLEGKRVMDFLGESDQVHADFRVTPRAEWACYDEACPPVIPPGMDKPEVPRLFRLYLRRGAKVCGPPALDRFFKTIDYLVLFDIDDLDADSRSTFFGNAK